MIGDVIAIPVGDGMHCVAQVIGSYQKRLPYVAVLDLEPRLDPPRPVPADVIATAGVALLALTADARVRHGFWSVVGNAPVTRRAWLPGYLVATAPDRYVVIDHQDERKRPATTSEIARVRFRRTVSPMDVELATRAWAGRGAWEESFAGLLPASHVPEDELF